MPKRFPESIKLEAMELFVAGDKTAKEIAEIVSQKNGSVVKPVTIYSWAKQYRWGQQKDVARTDNQQKIAESEGQRFARLQEEQLVRYTEVAAKANSELSGLTFNTAEGAVKALDTGIKGQRDVMQGTVDLGFVQEVLGILVDEVHGISCSNCDHKVDDQEVLNRVAIRLKVAVQNHGEGK
tara:strand:- start:427 stop:969 length:543 start_codon:yes stop_codon:yes gene_type:complete